MSKALKTSWSPVSQPDWEPPTFFPCNYPKPATPKRSPGQVYWDEAKEEVCLEPWFLSPPPAAREEIPMLNRFNEPIEFHTPPIDRPCQCGCMHRQLPYGNLLKKKRRFEIIGGHILDIDKDRIFPLIDLTRECYPDVIDLTKL